MGQTRQTRNKNQGSEELRVFLAFGSHSRDSLQTFREDGDFACPHAERCLDYQLTDFCFKNWTVFENGHAASPEYNGTIFDPIDTFLHRARSAAVVQVLKPAGNWSIAMSAGSMSALDHAIGMFLNPGEAWQSL